ncbi:MAG TPA: hypothetical protein CFH82_11075 [Sulfurospirillum sp. UBA12182]|jgi:hypothetical protein|nr:MAG TPA: hypothetical protein CFH82_11075 [Sulfurospirillum sp. UBA12182]
MYDQTPPQIEVIPLIKGFTCKALVYLIYSLITFTPFVVGGVLWYRYNIWIAIAFFLFLTLISGVVLSKLRVASIPFAQREMSYSNIEIVKWYVGKNICFMVQDESK